MIDGTTNWNFKPISSPQDWHLTPQEMSKIRQEVKDAMKKENK